MTRAAFTSRSWTAPQRHTHSLMLSGSFSAIVPHAEQVLLLGYHRSIAITSRPYQSALYSNWRRNSDHDASDIALASEWLRTMLRTDRSSMTTVCFRASARYALASLSRSRRSWRGFVTFSPVDSVTRVVRPASIPTAAAVFGSSIMMVSTRIET